MKKTLLPLLLLLLIFLSLHAQEPKPKRPGHFGLSYAGFALTQEEWDHSNDRYGGGTYGNGQYREKIFYTLGFNYLKPLNSRIDIETGLEYSRRLGEVKHLFLGDAITEKANTTIASFPLTIRANFSRFFFVNSGLLTDFDLGGSESKHFELKRYQSGIGYVIGLGVKYDFKSGAQIFINPYFKRRAIIQFWENDDRLRMNEAGIRVGMYFRAKKKIELGT